MARGEGQGEGRGEDTATNVAAGSGVAVALTICFFCVGVPVIFVGAVFIAIFPDTSLWDAGLAMIILSLLFIVGGIVMVILICTGVFNKAKVNQQPGAIHATGAAVVVTNHHVQPAVGYSAPFGQPHPAGYAGVPQPPAYNQAAPPPYQPEMDGKNIAGQPSDPAQGASTTAAPY